MQSHPPSDSSAPIAIVGGGPVGLSLALGLARHGVRSTLFERKPETSEYSKAAGIHVRTREIFRQWGIERRVVGEGVLLPAVTMQSAAPGGRRLFSLDFSELEHEVDRPGILMLEQRRTEKLLLDAVQETEMCDVRFEAEAVALEQGEHGARVTVREGGTDRSVDAEFVAGCDGASSFVRDALGLPFDGMTYSVRPMLADVRVNDGRDHLPWPRIRNRRGGLLIGLRIRPGLWRIIRLQTGEAVACDRVPDEEVRQCVDQVLGEGPLDVAWASRFRIHLRSSPRFRAGRVLLAGDAAHVHSPIGGLGMNAGVQDAHNLAWKLAFALRGGDMARLLSSYDVERRAVVVGNVSRYTDLLTRMFLQAPAMVREVAFVLMRLAFRVPPLRRMGLRRMTMIDLDYPGSPLLDPNERSAGVRLPNAVLWARDGKLVRLYDLLPNGPVMLDVADERDFSDSLPVDAVIRVGEGGYTDSTGLLRGLLGGRDGWILVRPDAHVAWARDSQEGMEQAVRHALGAA